MKDYWWAILLPVFILGWLFGGTVATRQLNKNISCAIEVMEEAEYLVHNTTEYGGELEFGDVCDTIWDDITDAIAWLEKEQ